jgi:hypothetical protein
MHLLKKNAPGRERLFEQIRLLIRYNLTQTSPGYWPDKKECEWW